LAIRVLIHFSVIMFRFQCEIRTSITDTEKIRLDLMQGKRCHLCLIDLDGHVRRVTGKRKLTSKEKRHYIRKVYFTENRVHKLMASDILARHSHIFDNETADSHRFSGADHFKVCQNEYLQMKKLFMEVEYNQDTPFFAYLNSVEADLPVEVNPPIGVDEGSDYEEDLSQQLSQLSQDDEPEYNINDDADDYFLPAVALQVDTDIEDDESDDENVHFELPMSQEQLVSVYWYSRNERNRKITVIDAEKKNSDHCIICSTMSEDKKMLTFEIIYDIIDSENIGIFGWDANCYLCSNCYPGESLSAGALDIIKSTYQTFTKTSKFKVGKVLQGVNDRFVARKAREEAILEYKKTASVDFESMTDEQMIDLVLHSKDQVITLVDYCKRGGVKKTKLNITKKVLVFLTYIRQDIGFRAMSIFFNISKSTISRIIEEVLCGLQEFSSKYSSCLNLAEILGEHTTLYSKMVHGADTLLLVCDGTYFYTSHPQDAERSIQLWSGQKKRHLFKAMTICATDGHLILPYRLYEGRQNDSKIMRSIFENQTGEFDTFIDLVKTKPCILICDRGFVGFRKWLESSQQQNPDFFPEVKVLIPVNQQDENDQYDQAAADESRKLVTSIRMVVEQVHGHQKIFGVAKNEHQLHFMDKHFHAIILFINGSLNAFGYARRGKPSIRRFSDEEKYLFLTENPWLFASTLNIDIHDAESCVYVNRRRFWTEYPYYSEELLRHFPKLSDKIIDEFTGGIYQKKKAKTYIRNLLNLLQIRADGLDSRDGSQATNTTATSSGTRKVYRVMSLERAAQEAHYPNFQILLRMDIPSFYSGSRKFKTFIAVKKVPLDGSYKFCFACTCSTGLRTTPCAHGILVLYLYAHRLK